MVNKEKKITQWRTHDGKNHDNQNETHNDSQNLTYNDTHNDTHTMMTKTFSHNDTHIHIMTHIQLQTLTH